ncbi:Alpha/Beta hydrolase protein [Scleroderma citrinum]
MWLPKVALGLLGLSIQQPFAPSSHPLPPPKETVPPNQNTAFALKSGSDIFSPQDMLSLPRPGDPLTNAAGDLALISISQYSFDDRKTHKSLAVVPLEVGSQEHRIPLSRGGDAFWLDPRTIAHVVEAEEGKKQDLYALPVTYEKGSISTGEPVLVGSFPITTAADFRYSAPSGVLVFSAYVYADDDLKAVKENDEAHENRGNSALVYGQTFERQWDTWVGPKHKSLFTVKLYNDNGQYVLGEHFVNVLKGTDLSSPVEPFGGTDDFDISDSQVILTAKDPKLPKAWHTKQNIYLVNFDGSNLVELTSGDHGATHAPAFNRQGTKVAWLQLDEDGHESDRHKIVIHDLTKQVSFAITQDWDRSPSTLAFSQSGDFLYFTAEDIARVKIFALPVPPTPSKSATHPTLRGPYRTPVALTSTHAASGLQVLPSGHLSFAVSSLTSPKDVYILSNLHRVEADIMNEATDIYRGELAQITKFSTDFLQDKFLHPGKEFWFEGAVQQIHGWILTPPGYKPTDVKKWPILLLIHGGPESCWQDSWSARWNPNVFANQGYFVVLINPTGSTSFGQNLTEGIKEDWGGKPFVDLRNGWQHILDHYPQVDPERAGAAGASWGGYAINWIQGNPEFGFNFKALFCHDGVFDTTYNGYATDELFFFNHEWGGRPWEPKSFELSRKYSPAFTVSKWSTPQLIVHGSKDYRLPESDGIGVFHALQQLSIPSRLVIFPDENHWVLKPGNSLKWHDEVFRWFGQFLDKKLEI